VPPPGPPVAEPPSVDVPLQPAFDDPVPLSEVPLPVGAGGLDDVDPLPAPVPLSDAPLPVGAGGLDDVDPLPVPVPLLDAPLPVGVGGLDDVDPLPAPVPPDVCDTDPQSEPLDEPVAPWLAVLPLELPGTTVQAPSECCAACAW
jgi:hypothetical protein